MIRIPERIIDFHVHLFPDRMFDAIRDSFSRLYNWDIIHRQYADECVRILHEAGVIPFVYSNYAHREGIARGLNDWNLRFLDTHEGVYCMAAYHPGDPDALDAARRMLTHPRVLGFKLQLLVQNFYPHDDRLFPLYDLVSEKNKRILFHAGTGPVGNEFTGVRHFERVMKRYPNLPATVAHLGAHEYREFLDLAGSCPRLFFDTAFCFLPGEYRGFTLDPGLLESRRDRILYGSDFPNLITPRDAEMHGLLELGLSQEFYDLVFRQNGERLIREHGKA